MKKFLPSWALTQKDEDEAEDDDAAQSSTVTELAKVLGVRAKTAKAPLAFNKWLAAFDVYALAAATAGQWPIAASYTHKAVCLQLAAEAKVEQRALGVTVVYDELVRRRMAERAYQNAPGYNPATPVAEVDKALLAQVYIILLCIIQSCM